MTFANANFRRWRWSWWTDTCPFCASSSPSLRVLHAEFVGKDFVLIGVFHPKAGRDDPLDVARVERAVAARQFEPAPGQHAMCADDLGRIRAAISQFLAE